MPILSYLHFNGNCREAFEFYRSVFGGEFAMMATFADGPADMDVPEAEANNVMHVTLTTEDGLLMGSDMPSSFGPPRVIGNNFALTFPTSSREQTDELFTKMSGGGEVTMPPQDTFWGAYFACCTDKFGINWQFNYELPQEG